MYKKFISLYENLYDAAFKFINGLRMFNRTKKRLPKKTTSYTVLIYYTCLFFFASISASIWHITFFTYWDFLNVSTCKNLKSQSSNFDEPIPSPFATIFIISLLPNSIRAPYFYRPFIKINTTAKIRELMIIHTDCTCIKDFVVRIPLILLISFATFKLSGTK